MRTLTRCCLALLLNACSCGEQLGGVSVPDAGFIDQGAVSDLGSDLGAGPDQGFSDQGVEDLGLRPDAGEDLGSIDQGPGDLGSADQGLEDQGVADLGLDSGVGDGGVVPQTCTSDQDCPGGVCLDDTTLTPCAGGVCSCADICDPYVLQSMSGCQGRSCTWMGPNAQPLALCLPDQGGGLHGQACTVTYNAMGVITQDSCNRTQNNFCSGTSPQQPSGQCARLCGNTNPGLCTSFGNYQCDDIEDPAAGYGLCLNPPPAITDIGNTCQAPGDCQGGLCSVGLAGACGVACPGLDACPSGSLCLRIPGEGLVCAATCMFGAQGDADCAGRNPSTVCENVGAAVAVCVARCGMDAECLSGQCDTNTGHCI